MCWEEGGGAAPAAVEHSGQMWKVHFATASHAEAAELEACTYPSATWHRKKGHSSLRNSLHTWRHPLVIRREATGRVFPVPTPTAPPPQARLAPGRVVGARRGSGGLVGCCLCHLIPNSGLLSASRLAVRAGAILAWIQPTQHFGLSLAVTEPRLRLSMPEPRQMLGYACLHWPSPRGFPG